MTMDKPTVLIVEDNATTRKMICVALESAGYGVSKPGQLVGSGNFRVGPAKFH
jgi:CheY-like chemotaxis protein